MVHDHFPNLASCRKIGFIVPSSNTAVEPLTQAILHALNDNVICIFTRIQVKTVGLDTNSRSQFSVDVFVQAAQLLADAQPDAILWNGTSGQWTGGSLENDKLLAQAMEDATGIPCSTTTLASVQALDHLQIKAMSIAVPYAEAHAMQVGKFFEQCGYQVVKTERLLETPPSNGDIAKSSMDDIRDVIRRSVIPPCEAILVSCTNWPATGLVEELEDELGVTVIDSISVTVWWALKLIGCKKSVSGWGRLLNAWKP